MTSHSTLDGALILAAGKGTRMHSPRPKVLHSLLGEPMLAHVAAALAPHFADRVFAVIGHEAESVRAAFAGSSLRFVEQTEQLGTGHALMTALPALREAGLSRVLVVNGDMPLLSPGMVARILRDAEGADVALATLTLPDPGAYGRVVRQQGRQQGCQQGRQQGQVTGIVEAKDYDPALHGPTPNEINAGLYVISMAAAERFLPRLSNANRTGEYYITDLVGMAAAEGLTVTGIDCGSDPDLLGVNNPVELARSEARLRDLLVQSALEAGVILHSPDLVHIGPRAVLEPGAEIAGPCHLYGATRLASGARVGPQVWLRDTVVEAGAVIHPFSHLDGGQVGEGCVVGPFARLRPGAVMEAESHVGNFVEMKKARLGRGAKANHLTYLGDADIGPRANVGAGTITCNYDGKNKFRTVIGEEAFIGSNTALVAPVTVGARALVGAGSVITKDVPDDALAVARGRQSNMDKKR